MSGRNQLDKFLDAHRASRSLCKYRMLYTSTGLSKHLWMTGQEKSIQVTNAQPSNAEQSFTPHQI